MSNTLLSNFEGPLNIAIIGASGGIGSAFTEILANQSNIQSIFAFSRSQKEFDHPKVTSGFLDLTDEISIENAAKLASENTYIDMTIVATGILHDDSTQPEKSLKDLSAEKFEKIFALNTIGPALVAKHFLPHIPKDKPSIFTALSARVGSIEDNHLGGWYAYRASKTALNMLLKNTSIEIARRYKQAAIIGLHPGTVDTNLSKPFQGFVKEGKLFTPQYSAECMIKVLNDRTHEDSGKIFAWDGQEIPY